MKRIAFFIGIVFSTVTCAEDSGWFGLAYRTSVGWTFKVQEASIAFVSAESPGARAGVKVGDIVTEIEGCAIPGCGANKAKRFLQRDVGETLRMKLQRPDGEEYSVALVAEPEPADFRAQIEEARRKLEQQGEGP